MENATYGSIPEAKDTPLPIDLLEGLSGRDSLQLSAAHIGGLEGVVESSLLSCF